MTRGFDGVMAAFNQSDPALRTTRLREVLAEGAEVTHIHGVAHGAEEFSAHIGTIREALGDALGRLEGEPSSLHDWSQQAWSLTIGGAPYASGTYTARFDAHGLVTHLLSLPDAH